MTRTWGRRNSARDFVASCSDLHFAQKYLSAPLSRSDSKNCPKQSSCPRQPLAPPLPNAPARRTRRIRSFQTHRALTLTARQCNSPPPPHPRDWDGEVQKDVEGAGDALAIAALDSGFKLPAKDVCYGGVVAAEVVLPHARALGVVGAGVVEGVIVLEREGG